MSPTIRPFLLRGSEPGLTPKCSILPSPTARASPKSKSFSLSVFFFFFQAEDGIRDGTVTGVQTCALPISNQKQVVIFLGLTFERRPALYLGPYDPPDSFRRCGNLSRPLASNSNHFVYKRSEERRVGKECRYRWSRDG